MNEVLAIAEIQERFDHEWVLLEDPELDSNLQVIRGKVLFHSKDRDELDRRALELRPRHSAILYNGPALPEGMEAVL